MSLHLVKVSDARLLALYRQHATSVVVDNGDADPVACQTTDLHMYPGSDLEPAG